jgi:hypothetical protein
MSLGSYGYTLDTAENTSRHAALRAAAQGEGTLRVTDALSKLEQYTLKARPNLLERLAADIEFVREHISEAPVQEPPLEIFCFDETSAADLTAPTTIKCVSLGLLSHCRAMEDGVGLPNTPLYRGTTRLKMALRLLESLAADIYVIHDLDVPALTVIGDGLEALGYGCTGQHYIGERDGAICFRDGFAAPIAALERLARHVLVKHHARLQARLYGIEKAGLRR